MFDDEDAPPAGKTRLNPVILAAKFGLIPTSPVIAVVPVLEIPLFARITKSPADRRLTSAATPITPGINTAVIRHINATVIAIEKMFLVLFFVLFMV
jgi:hypothetical protein